MTTLAQKAAENLTRVREQAPLIHNITNYVVMNYTANALLAAGASPVMAHAPEEAAEMATLAGALVLNIGTLSRDWVDAMILAGKQAAADGTPIVLDPVGAGATRMRTESARRILDAVPVRVVRGNASEIRALSGAAAATRGVDATDGVADAAAAAGQLALERHTTPAVTGPVDRVTDGKRVVRIANGHPLMARVTGTGCTATALIGAFLAVDPDPLTAAATALACFGVAGEVAGRQAAAPGSFMIALLDALYTLSPETLETACRMEEG